MTTNLEVDIVHVSVCADPLVDKLGHDPRSRCVEHCWVGSRMGAQTAKRLPLSGKRTFWSVPANFCYRPGAGIKLRLQPVAR